MSTAEGRALDVPAAVRSGDRAGRAPSFVIDPQTILRRSPSSVPGVWFGCSHDTHHAPPPGPPPAPSSSPTPGSRPGWSSTAASTSRPSPPTRSRRPPRAARCSPSTTGTTPRSPARSTRRCVLEAPTWRANPDWAATLGHDRAAAAPAHRGVGRRGRTTSAPDGPAASRSSSAARSVPAATATGSSRRWMPTTAAEYHSFQVAAMAAAGVDVVTR